MNKKRLKGRYFVAPVSGVPYMWRPGPKCEQDRTKMKFVLQIPKRMKRKMFYFFV